MRTSAPLRRLSARSTILPDHPVRAEREARLSHGVRRARWSGAASQTACKVVRGRSCFGRSGFVAERRFAPAASCRRRSWVLGLRLSNQALNTRRDAASCSSRKDAPARSQTAASWPPARRLAVRSLFWSYAALRALELCNHRRRPCRLQQGDEGEHGGIRATMLRARGTYVANGGQGGWGLVLRAMQPS